VIRIEDLEPELQSLLTSWGRHPKVVIATGARTVILYVSDRRIQKQVESEIPQEYLDSVQIVLTRKVRPARHEPASKIAKKRGTTRER
jgi:hypothetical protein